MTTIIDCSIYTPLETHDQANELYEQFEVEMYHDPKVAADMLNHYEHTVDVQDALFFAKIPPTMIELPDLNLDLLRAQVEWAKKSKHLQDIDAATEFDRKWNQNVWGQAPLDAPVETIQTEIVLQDFGGKNTHPVSVEAIKVEEGFCNTGCCLAGNVAMQVGDPIWIKRYDKDTWASMDYVRDPETGDEYTVSKFAENKLGLSHNEANEMFEADNTIERIEALAKVFAARRGLTY